VCYSMTLDLAVSSLVKNYGNGNRQVSKSSQDWSVASNNSLDRSVNGQRLHSWLEKVRIVSNL
jgi:hypothetical protein